MICIGYCMLIVCLKVFFWIQGKAFLHENYSFPSKNCHWNHSQLLFILLAWFLNIVKDKKRYFALCYVTLLVTNCCSWNYYKGLVHHPVEMHLEQQQLLEVPLLVLAPVSLVEVQVHTPNRQRTWVCLMSCY